MRLTPAKGDTQLQRSEPANRPGSRPGQVLAASADLAARRPVLVLAAALGVLLLVRLVALRLNATDLFFDEAQYWSWSLEPAFGYYSKPPLIAWLIGLSTGVCGTSEFCIRLPAPLLHTATAAALYALGRRLYDVRTGLLSALLFATLPAVSLSSGIISTDVPLLLCWALALIGFAGLLDERGWWPAILLGAAIGAGLNAKYAMAWFVPCAAIYLFVTPQRREILRDMRLWTALGLGVLLIMPNLAWNVSNGFATFAHTADNAKWGGSLINPLKALEFFGAQFGVFGPILFAGLLIVSWRAWRQGLPEPDRLLLAFALPVLAAITVQALLSRAHANWAVAAKLVASMVNVRSKLARAPGISRLATSISPRRVWVNALFGCFFSSAAIALSAASYFRCRASVAITARSARIPVSDAAAASSSRNPRSPSPFAMCDSATAVRFAMFFGSSVAAFSK